MHDQGPEAAITTDSWLEKLIAAPDALYHRFGRDGLCEQEYGAVADLLSEKRGEENTPDVPNVAIRPGHVGNPAAMRGNGGAKYREKTSGRMQVTP